MTAAVTLSICRTCRPDGAPPDADPPGARLGRATVAAARARGVENLMDINAIACLSACSRACSASVAGAEKFGYVIGGLTLEDADDLVTFALAHAESVDGIPPWRARPERIRKNTVARLPPHGCAHPLVEEPAPAPAEIADDAVSRHR